MRETAVKSRWQIAARGVSLSNPYLCLPLLNPGGIRGKAQEAKETADTQVKKSKPQQPTDPVHSRGQVGVARLGKKEAYF